MKSIVGSVFQLTYLTRGTTIREEVNLCQDKISTHVPHKRYDIVLFSASIFLCNISTHVPHKRYDLSADPCRALKTISTHVPHKRYDK